MLDEDHPDWIAVKNALFVQAAQISAHEPFSIQLVKKLQSLCDSATQQAKTKGIDFPDMIVAYFKKRRLIRIWRRDADKKLIEDYIRQLVVERPEMDFLELTIGIRRAFPSYVMSDWIYYRTKKKEVN